MKFYVLIGWIISGCVDSPGNLRPWGGSFLVVEQLWRDGQEVRGWARYWAYIYAFLGERLAANAALSQAATVVRFEDLCAE